MTGHAGRPDDHDDRESPNAATRQAFLSRLAFPLDPFQVAALDALDRGRSVLVAAPTGAGKTLVAEYAVDLALARGAKAFYTTPLKALSNQKFIDLSVRLGRHRVGLLTGDNSINPTAPVVVMTTEVLRNMIYASSSALAGLRYVVLDEVHYLQNPYRGAVWEEVIVHAPQEVTLVCLSATVSNAEEVAEWLTTVRGATTAVIEEHRPVPLVHHYLVGDHELARPLLLPTFVDDRPNPEAANFDAGRPRPHRGPIRHKQYRPSRPEVVELLWEEGMLPAIYFVFSRSACDEAVKSCLGHQVRLTSPEERSQIRDIADSHLDALSDADLAALGYSDWMAGLEAGIAAHHAGLVPPFKEAVEACFTTALVKVVFATETLSLGINMPARTVVIDSLTKFTGERHEPLTAGEYTQLTGRAGRRGTDDVGHAVVPWSPWSPFSAVAGLASTRSYELTSSFRPTYNMTANLARRYSAEEARHLLNLSFAQYRADAETVLAEARLERTKRQLAEARAAAACELGDIYEYRAMMASAQGRRHEPRPESMRSEVEAVLGRLRPGDVFAHRDQLHLVLATARRKGGTTKLAAVSRSGRRSVFGAGDFRQVPASLARLELPSPYNPSDAGFVAEAAKALKQSKLSLPPSPRIEEGRHRGGRSQALTSAVADCPDLRAHLRAADRADRLAAEVERLSGVARRRGRSLARQMDRVSGLLEQRGYMSGWALTNRGERLVRIYHEQDLLIAECIDEGFLDGLAAPELAGLCSVFTYESRGRSLPDNSRGRSLTDNSRSGRGNKGFGVNPTVAARWLAIEALWDSLQRAEVAAELPLTRAPDPGLMGLARAWVAGRPMAGLVESGDISGGDFVRNMRQLADLLRQLSEVVPDALTAGAAHQAATSCFRGVVAASSVLEIHDGLEALA